MLFVAAAHASLSFFIFGWHTHEKGIVVPILLLGYVAVREANREHLTQFDRVCAHVAKDIGSIHYWLSSFGHFSLLPLLYQADGMSTVAQLVCC